MSETLRALAAERRPLLHRWLLGDRSPELLAALAASWAPCPELAEAQRALAAWRSDPTPPPPVAIAAVVSGPIWSRTEITRLHPFLAQCPYAAGQFRGCGCRGCWWRGGRDVALRDCLECMAPLVEPTEAIAPSTEDYGL